MGNDKLNLTADTLVRWYLRRLLELPAHSCLEKCELLLTAADLHLWSRKINRVAEAFERDEKTPPSGEDMLFYSLARQLVLMRFQVGQESRQRFLEHWIVGEKFRGEPITTVAFLMTLALQQLTLLPAEWRDYVKDWFVRHDDFDSDRYAAWSCYCLVLAGYDAEARIRAEQVLARREANGSWAYELRRTIACCYPLAMAKLVDKGRIADTLEYIVARLTPGFSSDVATQAQALKTLFCLDAVPEHSYRHLVTKISNESSVFLSHSNHDKHFVRRLAADLQARGVRVWLDEAELLPGDSLFEKIESAVEAMQYLAVVLTSRSVGSAWVKKELRMAQIQELAEREVRVLPLLVENCNIPLSLRDVVWADFSKDYSVGLEQMLRKVLPGL